MDLKEEKTKKTQAPRVQQIQSIQQNVAECLFVPLKGDTLQLISNIIGWDTVKYLV